MAFVTAKHSQGSALRLRKGGKKRYTAKPGRSSSLLRRGGGVEEKLVGEHEGRQAASQPARAEVAAIKEAADTVKANIQRVMVVKEEVIEMMLVSLLCDGHILIEDVPGIGKTTLAK